MSTTTEASRRKYSSDIAFTAAVKATQERKGSRRVYGRMERSTGWQTDHRSRARRVPGGLGHVLPRHRERRRPALHPVSRCMALAAQGKIRHTVKTVTFEQINEYLDRLRAGEIVGRAVIKF